MCTLAHPKVEFSNDQNNRIHIWQKNNSRQYFIIEGSTSFVKILCDGNTKSGSLFKVNHLIQIFSTLFKGNNLFTTSKKNLLMKVFWGSSPFLYDDILPKTYIMKPRMTTFQSLEHCFLETFQDESLHFCENCLKYIVAT